MFADSLAPAEPIATGAQRRPTADSITVFDYAHRSQTLGAAHGRLGRRSHLSPGSLGIASVLAGSAEIDVKLVIAHGCM